MNPTADLDAGLIDRISRQCATLSRDFDRMGADLYALSVAVERALASPDAAPAQAAAQAAPAPAVAPAPRKVAAPPPSPARPVHPQPGPAQSIPRPGPAQPVTPQPGPAQPVAPQQPVAGPVAAAAPVASREAADFWAATPAGPPSGTLPTTSSRPAWWQRDGWVSRALALAGVGITLAGVVMLLVLAAKAGLLRPEVRVVMGAALAAALVWTGHRVSHRPGGRVGAVALASTGIAAAYLDIVAVTSIYGWVNAPVGLALAGAVAAGGILTAMRWRSPHLAVIVNVACAVTAPVLTSGVTLTLVLFYLVFQLAGAVPELLRGWSVIAPVRTAPVVASLLWVTAREVRGGRWLDAPSVAPHATTLTLAVLAAAIGLAVGVWGASAQTRPEITALSAGLATIPLLYVAQASGSPTSWILGLTLAVACWAVLLLVKPSLPVVRAMLASVGGIGLLVACVAVPHTQPALDAAPFLVVAVVSAALATRTRSRVVQAYAAAYGVLGAVLVLVRVPPEALADELTALQTLRSGAVLVGALLLAATLLAAVAAHRAGVIRTWPLPSLAVAGAVGLYAATVVCVAVPVAIGGGDASFRIGHFVATTVWMLTGCGVLVLGLNRPAHARLCLASGLTIVAAALAKLVTYDMSTLSGFTRAATFIVAGVLLLVAGTRYARVFAEREGASAVSG